MRHPGGDLLIDAGFSADVAAHVKAQPRLARAPYKVLDTVSDQFDAAGYDRDRLRGVLITHAHWDHVGGLDQLQLPTWMNQSELRYAAEDSDGKVYRTVSQGHEIRQYEFDDKPYLGFPSSYDVHGDGSVVESRGWPSARGWYVNSPTQMRPRCARACGGWRPSQT